MGEKQHKIPSRYDAPDLHAHLHLHVYLQTQSLNSGVTDCDLCASAVGRLEVPLWGSMGWLTDGMGPPPLILGQ